MPIVADGSCTASLGHWLLPSGAVLFGGVPFYCRGRFKDVDFFGEIKQEYNKGMTAAKACRMLPAVVSGQFMQWIAPFSQLHVDRMASCMTIYEGRVKKAIGELHTRLESLTSSDQRVIALACLGQCVRYCVGYRIIQ